MNCKLIPAITLCLTSFMQGCSTQTHNSIASDQSTTPNAWQVTTTLPPDSASATYTASRTTPEQQTTPTTLGADNEVHNETESPDRDPTPAVALTRPAKVLFKYGFNHKDLPSEDKAIIEQHARFLVLHPDLQIEIHGHADIQGDPEYNRYLAQQRALKIAELLIAKGVNKQQIVIKSWGSDKPLHQLSDWKNNRRAEILYPEEFAQNHQ